MQEKCVDKQVKGMLKQYGNKKEEMKIRKDGWRSSDKNLRDGRM